jgi:adenosylcobinamide-phosphate synthase
MFPVTNVIVALIAAALEAAVGYPQALYRVLGHPVTCMGRWLEVLERRLNRPSQGFGQRRTAGFLALGLYLAPVATVGAALQLLSPQSLLAFAVAALVAASLPAQRSLYAHVKAVADALGAGGESLAAGRQAVGQIVGRNVEVLDAAGVARAAIESLAENFSDGVVAPLFWTALLGVAGGLVYKGINTADSMIGHRNDRYEAFGYAAAKLDDGVNWPAARLSALWIALAAGGKFADAIEAARRDAPKHRSPNAGWSEAAMAGALGLKLAGPRVYGAVRIEDAFMGDGRAEANAEDIFRALAVYKRACFIEGAALLGAASLILIV